MMPMDRALQQWRFRMAKPYVPQGARLLDIGSRDAGLLLELGDRIGPSVGIDSMGTGDASLGDHQLLAGYFPARVPDGMFDAATLLAVVEHMSEQDLVGTAKALSQAVRPGGPIIVSVPSPAVDHILDVLVRLRLAEGMDAESHHGFDTGTLVPLWEEHGLRLRTRRSFQLGLNNLFVFEVPPDRPSSQTDENRPRTDSSR